MDIMKIMSTYSVQYVAQDVVSVMAYQPTASVVNLAITYMIQNASSSVLISSIQIQLIMFARSVLDCAGPAWTKRTVFRASLISWTMENV